jgi:UDP-N-acetylmuramate: L-alanyl-gamma-D-glutamyl-meso-diaminopimelate ligase
MNVFPTFENYVSQFEEFINLIGPGGTLIYCLNDPEVVRLANSARRDVKAIPYGNLSYKTEESHAVILTGSNHIPLMIFGQHNVENVHGAWMVCRQAGVTDEQFLVAISTFKGASKRLQLLGRNANTVIYKDFAHSPSKLKATIHAVKEIYPERELIACLELHTYSSLNKDFLPLYQGCMELADIPIVYYSHHALALKRLPELKPEEVREAFNDARLEIFNDSGTMQEYLMKINFRNKNLLMMSSGNFDGLNLEEMAEEIINTT